MKGSDNMANNERDVRGRFKVHEDLTPIQLKMIVELLDNGGNKTEACRKLGVPRTTLYTWIDNTNWQEEYRRACERLYKVSLAKYMDKLDKMLECKDNRTVMKALETGLRLNGYLKTDLNIDKNTTETITIKLVDDSEDVD
ncbi:hypothetical protein DSECCO2_266220 [anaerobic digester metagenome]